jgi:hypothetical protein
MDFSHVVKKIRNNILKSGTEAYCTRHLIYGDKFIEWDHFRKAYLWDISSSSFPVHHKLTQEHIHVHVFLTSVNKMRNHLAEEVLNSEMLHLMELYKESLGHAESGVKHHKPTNQPYISMTATLKVFSLISFNIKIQLIDQIHINLFFVVSGLSPKSNRS